MSGIPVRTGRRRGGGLAVKEHPDDPETHQDHRDGVRADPLRPEQIPRSVREAPDEIEDDAAEERERVEPECHAPGKGDLGHAASKEGPTINLFRSTLR